MPEKILVVDDEQIIRESISYILKKDGYSVSEADNGREAYNKLLAESFDLVITDLEMPEMKGIELLERITKMSPETSVVIITAYGSLDTAIAALRAGASDYTLKPIEFDELQVKIRRLFEYKKLAMENQYLRRELHREANFSNLVGNSAPMQRVFDLINRVSLTDSTVLITGKSGTGKELAAKAIHFNSKRKDLPFITVNCGAIPETLIESELFGHKKGAFTGAVADKMGYFKAADSGTLFLDEISEMPMQLQVKLLRAIEQKEITPVGMSVAFSVDVRFIAATNRDLQKEVAGGRFREDLFYRLNVVDIKLPSLAERKEDIPLLVDHFVKKFREEMRKDIQGVDNTAMQMLIQHEWKGEIREPENVIARAVIFCNNKFISVNELPEFFHSGTNLEISDHYTSLEAAMNNLERQYILSELRKHNFNKENTAQALRISLPTLYRRIKDLEIPQE
ncbi:MAG: sigma-54-dependent Fis family transcriptional regulator [Ignavibacteriales bacterium]|nr:sigma-54-dependent Fis family transcriptional regulator [Ignavibacteriales bacterium]